MTYFTSVEASATVELEQTTNTVGTVGGSVKPPLLYQLDRQPACALEFLKPRLSSYSPVNRTLVSHSME